MPNSISGNPFKGLPLATLQDLQAKYVQVLSDIASGGQSYTFPGRSFTRSDLKAVAQTLGDINMAISFTPGGASAGQQGNQIAYAYRDTNCKW